MLDSRATPGLGVIADANDAVGGLPLRIPECDGAGRAVAGMSSATWMAMGSGPDLFGNVAIKHPAGLSAVAGATPTAAARCVWSALA